MRLVYAVSQVKKQGGWVPDYGLSPATVFIDVAERLSATVGTEILCQVQNFSELPGLPSRVPDWSVAG